MPFLNIHSFGHHCSFCDICRVALVPIVFFFFLYRWFENKIILAFGKQPPRYFKKTMSATLLANIRVSSVSVRFEKRGTLVRIYQLQAKYIESIREV